MRGVALRIVALGALVIAMTAAPAAAHGLRTAHLDVAEVTPGHGFAQLQLVAPDPTLGLSVGPGCTATRAGDSVLARSWTFDCDGPLLRHRLALSGLGPITADAVVSLELADGTSTTQLVRADAPEVAMPSDAAAAAASGYEVASRFIRLGVIHIATGYDHLLFLLLLVLLLRRPRSVLLAETAFTVSHSVSFSATALGWIHVSSAAAETCIAVSLLMLAVDVDPRRPPETQWRGAAMALVFGLVHGLGFAGGLREIGLPEHAIGPALLGFGAGIEIGQIAFLALVLTALHLTRSYVHRPRAELTAIYAIGGFSAYLVIARGLAIL